MRGTLEEVFNGSLIFDLFIVTYLIDSIITILEFQFDDFAYRDPNN